MEVKDIIYNKRTELGLTMKELADMVGVSEATISRWESGDIENMKRDKIAKLVKVLDVPIEVIMGWDEQPHVAVPDLIIDVLDSKYSDQLLEYAEMLNRMNLLEERSDHNGKEV